MDARRLLGHLLNTCGLFAFPIHTITSQGHCTCRKGKDCGSPGKHPYLNLKWKDIATNSMIRLDSWSKKRPVNYAICTGRQSTKTGKYLVVVDVDRQDHEIIKTLPQTFCYKTGSGGFHFWFWSSVPVKNSASQLAEKVDIRGTGGYVIVPPSKHISGKSYELLCEETQEVANLPQVILDELARKTKADSAKIKGKSKTTVNSGRAVDAVPEVVSKWWSKTPIATLRASLASGNKIPLGVRNIVTHRLLSSDRAKGAATYEDLFSRGLEYRKVMEMPDSFEDRELRNIVCSVMRYPVYNNEADNVNKNYAKWMSKFSPKKIEAATLDAMDKTFFSRLRPSVSTGISLKSLAQTRKEWYASNQMQEGFATYRSQLLAKKLKSLGFERTRSAKQNLWNVDMSQVFEVQNEASPSYPAERKMNMSDEKTLTPNDPPADSEVAEETVVSEEEGSEDSSGGRLGPDGKPLTLIEEREEVIKTKAKYHPNDEKYVGRDSTQEQMSALIKFYAELSPQQEQDYEAGTLLFDEERTRDWMTFLKPGDVIGLKNQMYKVVGTSENEIVCSPRGWDKYERKAHFNAEPETFSLYDVDMALNLALGEILYRDDAPFGVEEEMAYKVKVSVYADSVGRTYVFKSGRKIITGNEDKKQNDN